MPIAKAFLGGACAPQLYFSALGSGAQALAFVRSFLFWTHLRARQASVERARTPRKPSKRHDQAKEAALCWSFPPQPRGNPVHPRFGEEALHNSRRSTTAGSRRSAIVFPLPIRLVLEVAE